MATPSVAAMRVALRRAADCEGAMASVGAANLGAAIFGPRAPRVVGRGSDARHPAWARALRAVGGEARGATLCVTTLAGDPRRFARDIAEAGVSRVVVAANAESGRHAGVTVALHALRRRGVEVQLGLPSVAQRAHVVHRRWWHFERTGRPWVTLKAAISLDGKVATKSGHSQWITGEDARREAHRLRASHGAIGVGLGTLLADDPGLDVRLVRGHSPRPVIFDSELRCMARRTSSFRALRPGTIVLHRRQAVARRLEWARERGLETAQVRARRAGGLDVESAVARLAELGVSSLMVEGGGRLLSSFVAANAYEELWVFVAPRLLGGDAQPLLPGLDWGRVDRGVALEVRSRRALGRDQLWVCAPAGSPS